MGYSLSDTGFLYSFSNLANLYDSKEISKLLLPDGRTFRSGENGIEITPFELSLYKTRSLDVMNKILNSNTNIITFSPFIPSSISVLTDIELEEYNELKKKLIKELNIHSLTKTNSYNREEALKNSVVDQIFNVVLNPKNQINLYSPISMSKTREAAKNSSLGKIEKELSSDNPASKAIVQILNMEGKKVIGMVATAIKTFFSTSYYYNKKFDTIIENFKNNDIDSVINTLKQLVFENKWENRLSVIANTNLDSLISYLNKNGINEISVYGLEGSIFEKFDFYQNGILRFGDLITYLNENNYKENVAGVLSELLSSSTDNAKELTLSKINATMSFINIYTYLLTTGIEFNKIVNIMTSNIFNNISQVAQLNIFDPDTYGFKLTSAIKFYLNKDVLPFVDKEVLNFLIPDNNTLDYLSNPQNVSELRDKVLIEINKLEQNSKNNYELDEFNNFDDFEAIMEFDEVDAYTQDYDVPNFRNFAVDKVTYSEYVKILKFLNYVDQRNGINIENSEDLNKIADNIVPAMEEMRLLGRMLGINQGMKTNRYDMYSFLKSIDIFVNKRFVQNKLEAKFNINEFLVNRDYQNQMVSEYEKIKTTYNILDIITFVPHFDKMFRLLHINESIVSWFSARNNLENQLTSKIVINPNKKINNVEFREVSKFANDIIITNWIGNLNKSIIVPPENWYYTNKFGNKLQTLSNKEINLNSLEGIATFKMLFENYIIPELQNNSKYWTNGNPNEFLNNIIVSLIEDKKSKQLIKYVRPILNMMDIDTSQKTQLLYSKMLEDFNSLKGEKFLDWEIIDLFYLYNIIVHKDSFGQGTFVRFFEDVYTENQNLLINNFYEYLSNLDNTDSKNNLSYDLRDLQVRLSSYPNSQSKFDVYKKDDKIYTTLDNITRITELSELNPDFTFVMPFGFDMNTQRFKSKTKPIQKKSDNYYQINLDSKEVIKSIADNFMSMYSGKLHFIDNEIANTYPDELAKNAKAFIENGEVYINLDKADISDPLHEFTHIILSGLKYKYPEIYYHLLSLVENDPVHKILMSDESYKNKHGSDLKEEVFVQIMSRYFKNKMDEWKHNNEFVNTDVQIKDILSDIFKIDNSQKKKFSDSDIHDLMSSNVDNILEIFGSKLINVDFGNILGISYVQMNQKAASLKNYLIERGIIKKDCN